MSTRTWDREDYRELLELMVIYLGGNILRPRQVDGQSQLLPVEDACI